VSITILLILFIHLLLEYGDNKEDNKEDKGSREESSREEDRDQEGCTREEGRKVPSKEGFRKDCDSDKESGCQEDRDRQENDDQESCSREEGFDKDRNLRQKSGEEAHALQEGAHGTSPEENHPQGT
jgi:hypothetical protein